MDDDDKKILGGIAVVALTGLFYLGGWWHDQQMAELDAKLAPERIARDRMHEELRWWNMQRQAEWERQRTLREHQQALERQRGL